MDNIEKLEKEIRKIIYNNTPICGTMVSTEDRVRNEIKCEQKMVDELVELIQTEKLFSLLQEPPKLELQGENKMIEFETKNYHGKIQTDFLHGWFEHNEYGEEDGGSFEISIKREPLIGALVEWKIIDVDCCYDVAEEVKMHLDNIIE